MVFRLQDSVPSIYVEQSRDFQLLCRLMDCSQGALKYDIDTIVNILDASLIRDSLLQLLCTKVGFFPRIEIDANILKYIVAAFPYILKYKGTKLGIEYAVRAILKSEFGDISKEPPIVEITQSKPKTGDQDIYIIKIASSLSDYSIKALEEVLYYIKPIGYSYFISSVSIVSGDKTPLTSIGVKDGISILKVDDNNLSKVAGNNSMYIGDNWKQYTGTPPIYGNTTYGNEYGENLPQVPAGNSNFYYQNSPVKGTMLDENGNEVEIKANNNGLIDPRFIGYGKVFTNSIQKENENE